MNLSLQIASNVDARVSIHWQPCRCQYFCAEP